MRVPNLLKQLAIFFTAFCASAISATAQQPQNQNPDVIRVNTSLVQTDVMVFDKQGKFVDELKREQFVLKVDGKPREISFFELVKAGSSNEEAQIAAARGAASNAGAPVPLDRGRLVFFFIDDLHLSQESMHHTRKLLSRFVDREARQNDRIAIVAASGQIGFLQQLTDNKTVLRKAIERLGLRNRTTKDFERPAMSEHQAHLIDRYDQDVLNYFVEALVRDNIPRGTAEQMVRQRALSMLEQSAQFSIHSLASLQQLTKSAANLAGRKLVFFISDGFLMNARDAVRVRVRDLTAQAARAGVVIYSIDARGLVASLADIADPVAFDPTGRLQRASIGELTTSQDGMHALAVDTGGRALFNTNDLFKSVTTGLAETSKYYLLAWRPESEVERPGKERRLEVAITGRPELVVRFRRNFEDRENSVAPRQEKSAQATSPELLREALRTERPNTALPVHLALNFLDLPNRGLLLATSIRIATAQIPLEVTNGNATAQIDFAIVVLDERGNSVKSTNQTLNLRSVSATAITTPPDFVFFNDFAQVKPGLYQIRVAAVERKTRRTGSMAEWIEIPNLESKKLVMSSLIVAEKPSAGVGLDISTDDRKPGAEANPFTNLRLSVDRRFASNSNLRFLMFVYNAATAASAEASAASPTVPAGARMPLAVPDLAVQVQMFRDDQPIVTTPARKIQTEGLVDMTRVPYAADISLNGLQAGIYVLQVTVIDRIAKTTASQSFKFQVD